MIGCGWGLIGNLSVGAIDDEKVRRGWGLGM